MPTTTNKARRPLKTMLCASCIALLCNYVPQFEGTILKGYTDPIGIVTACTGHTRTAILGRPYTVEECQELLQDDLSESAEVVERCITPDITYYQRAALISFAYNVGPGSPGVKDGLCLLKNGNQPQIRQRFNRGDYVGGCKAIAQGWNTANGKVLSGLTKRRLIERDICEGKF